MMDIGSANYTSNMQMERERDTCMQEGGQRRQKKRQQTKWIGKKAHTKKYIIRTAHRTSIAQETVGMATTHCMTMEKGLLGLKAAANEASPNNDSRQGGLARMIQHAVR